MRKGFISELIKGQTVESLGMNADGNATLTFTNKSVLVVKATNDRKDGKGDWGVTMILDDSALIE